MTRSFACRWLLTVPFSLLLGSALAFAQGTAAMTEVADAALLPSELQGGHVVASELKEFLVAPPLDGATPQETHRVSP